MEKEREKQLQDQQAAREAAAAGREEEEERGGEQEYSQVRVEIENGVHQLETLLEANLDKNFDRLEIFLLRNVLSIPEDLVGWVRLGHYEVCLHYCKPLRKFCSHHFSAESRFQSSQHCPRHFWKPVK